MNALDLRLRSLDNYMHDISLQIAAYEYSHEKIKLNVICEMCEELREYIDDYMLVGKNDYTRNNKASHRTP